MRGDEVEAAWAWTDPIIEGLGGREEKPKLYDSTQPARRTPLMLLHRDGRRWREIEA